ncbi:MAG: dTDP-glucose 4,6-dehydratase [Candidatus Omnitrophica bacterium]|nr:dTDP-glucose 4,6-dehydratase [Candidatus Omnitrophota bacterium]
MKKRKILVTGGAGFIGREFVRQAVKEGKKLVVVDSLTYAGDMARLKEFEGKIEFFKADIGHAPKLIEIFKKTRPDAVIHFAAETHVDRSILGSGPFIKTNVEGTQVLLDVSKNFEVSRFIHISTDEVYGDVLKGRSIEDSPIVASSPYSASKAAADLLVRSYVRTFGFPAIVVRPSNNYGPWQYPEKFIPVVIHKALNNEHVPIYAQGLNEREWLFVGDCANAVLTVLKKGKPGEAYNVSSGDSKKNIDVAKRILDILGKPHSLLTFVKDRPGHDLRYALHSSKIKNQLGWEAETSFSKGLEETVLWYQKNALWCARKALALKHHWSKVYIKKS